MRNNLPKIGDIIMSERFVYGYYNGENKKVVTIDGRTTERPVTYSMSEDDRVALAAKSGIVPPKTRIVELGAYDASRAQAKFVVETGKMQGGGTGHGHNDIFPDGWYVSARRLSKDGTYDPKNESIEFYMTGCFTCMVETKDIQIVGKMEI